jgi:hypothetical protein
VLAAATAAGAIDGVTGLPGATVDGVPVAGYADLLADLGAWPGPRLDGVPSPHPPETPHRVLPLAERLRARGLRLTTQRQRVLAAVAALEHATPEEIATRLREEAGPDGAAPDTSTVYRNLELLERLGLVWHTHLGKGAPVYHAGRAPAPARRVRQAAGRSPRSTRHCSTAPRNVWRPTSVSSWTWGTSRCRDVPRVPRTSRIGVLMSTPSPLLSPPRCRPRGGRVRPGALRQPAARAARARRGRRPGRPQRPRRARRPRCRPADLAAQPADPAPRAARRRHGAEALELSPNGHVEHHLVLAELAGTTWVDVEPGTGAALQAYLERMRLHAPRRAGAGHRRVGAAVAGRPAAPGCSPPRPAGPGPYAVRALDGGGWVRRMPPSGTARTVVDLLVPRGELAAAPTR